MEITLNEKEADLLRGLFTDMLPALQREVARTEQHDLRHLLVQRQEIVERLARELKLSKQNTDVDTITVF